MSPSHQKGRHHHQTAQQNKICCLLLILNKYDYFETSLLSFSSQSKTPTTVHKDWGTCDMQRGFWSCGLSSFHCTQWKRSFKRHFDIFTSFLFPFSSFLATCQIISAQHQSRPLEQVSPVGRAAFWQIQLSQKGDFAHWLQKKLPLCKKYRRFLETRGKKSSIKSSSAFDIIQTW